MKNHTVQQFSSSVGSVVDVATPSTRKLKALGFLWALIALSTLALINYIIFDVFISHDPGLGSHALLGAALIPFIGWFALGSAVQRFHAASSHERYLRAGPGGISVSLTDDGGSATFRFSCRTVSFDLPWDQIRTWYPYVESMNGIPTERSIVFENLKGEKIKIKTYHFAEKQKEIAASIDRARLLHVMAVEQTHAGEANQRDTTATGPRLAKGLAEASFEVKKKRDTLREIDLKTIPGSQRAAYIEKVADVLEAKLVSLCPTAAGYRYSRKRYRPFREWKNVLGVRLFVQHGLLSGYEIQVEPNDSECRKLTISMCPSSLITDLRRYLSMAAGIVFFVASFTWLPAIQNWLGGFSELAPLVMVIMCCAALGVFTGLLQAPISLLRLLVSDKQKEEVRKQQIKLGVQEVA